MKRILILTMVLGIQLSSQASNGIGIDQDAQQIRMLIEQTRKDFSEGELVTVGSQADCDFNLENSGIQQAIDSGASVIRLAASLYRENLIIDDRSIEITGGYDTCADAAANISNGEQQVIDGQFSPSPVLTIRGTTQRNDVSLNNLIIRGGFHGGLNSGAGVNIVNADVFVNLNNVQLTENLGKLGGGLAVINGDADIFLKDTFIFQNSAENGGGIHCSGPNSSIIMDGESSINDNIANNDGGGIHVAGGCFFQSYSGSKFNGHLGIFQNSAKGHGGGIAVVGVGVVGLNGSMLCATGMGPSFCLGNKDQPANVSLNFADSDQDGNGFGGGIYASGQDVSVSLTNVLINGNIAQSGGGLAIENQASLSIQTRFFENTCWRPGSCSRIVDNRTASENSPVRGGGLYATSGSQVLISRTELSRNNSDFGTAIYAFSDNNDLVTTSVDINGALIVDNGLDGTSHWRDSDTIRNNNALMNISYSTIADNDATDTSANIFNTGEVGNLRLFNSIIHNNDGLPVFRGLNHDSTDFYECLLLNETESLPIETSIIVGNPHFVDRERGNYHLHPLFSEAIDFCYEDDSFPRFKDIDNDIRGIDNAQVSHFMGFYDAGYDESNDLIFNDGFEVRN